MLSFSVYSNFVCPSTSANSKRLVRWSLKRKAPESDSFVRSRKSCEIDSKLGKKTARELRRVQGGVCGFSEDAHPFRKWPDGLQFVLKLFMVTQASTLSSSSSKSSLSTAIIVIGIAFMVVIFICVCTQNFPRLGASKHNHRLSNQQRFRSHSVNRSSTESQPDVELRSLFCKGSLAQSLPLRKASQQCICSLALKHPQGGKLGIWAWTSWDKPSDSGLWVRRSWVSLE